MDIGDKLQKEVSFSREFINRELSMLKFNQRVLEQAKDDKIPLLERLKFLCICGTNMDEFFEIRVAGLKEKELASSTRIFGPDNVMPKEVLNRISEKAHELIKEQYEVLNDIIIPELSKNNIHILKRHDLNEKQAVFVADYFREEVLPVLSPFGLDPSHPFPRIQNKNLNLERESH